RPPSIQSCKDQLAILVQLKLIRNAQYLSADWLSFPALLRKLKPDIALRPDGLVVFIKVPDPPGTVEEREAQENEAASIAPSASSTESTKVESIMATPCEPVVLPSSYSLNPIIPDHRESLTSTPSYSLKHSSHAHDEAELHEEHAASRHTHLPTDTATSSSNAALPTHYMPVRRPRRGKPTMAEFDRLSDFYHNLGRKFKYSGDARFWSTLPPRHKEFRPLFNPPAPGSPYHTAGSLMSRLELVDALLCFVYALWCIDTGHNRCSQSNWMSVGPFLSWCKQMWQQGNHGAREKAFFGLVHMIEAFIHQHKVRYAIKSHLRKDIAELVKSLSSERTPPGMLPPTPSTCISGSPNETQGPTSPASVLATSVTARLEASVPQTLIWEIKDVIETQNAASYTMDVAQQYLSIPIIREHFPRLFGRMMYSGLTAQDEYEPDMEDDEGELFWPGQCVAGGGLGWVCLMGRGMVKEFGKDVGYEGSAGIIRKPDAHERRPVDL
ncbi:hypothetical protein BD410DRAFT_284978, partial [Rickenella mellea]